MPLFFFFSKGVNVEQQYPSNSKKSKEMPKPIPVVTEQVTTRKKGVGSRLADIFLPTDINTLRNSIISDVIVPAVRDTIISAVSTAFGGGSYRSQAYSQPTSRFAYNQVSKPVSTGTTYQSNVSRKTYEFDNLVFPSRGSAEAVLDEMLQRVATYDLVRVSDYFELANISCDYTAQGYGWSDLSTARVIKIPGGWTISLPRAYPIN